MGHGYEAVEDEDDGELQLPYPYPPERMVPLKGKASEGRVNPKGLPCLYVSTTEETAVAEVRPWVGAFVSVAQFETVRELRVIDCTLHEPVRSMWLGEPSPEKRERKVWSSVDQAFSKPVEPSNLTAEYAPTQIISEWFKHHGFDGIVYGSALGDGVNLACFDIAAASVQSCKLVKITSVAYQFKQENRGYRCG